MNEKVQNNQKLLKIITKTVMLSGVLLLLTIVSNTFLIITFTVVSHQTEWINQSFTSFDSFTNVLCIFSVTKYCNKMCLFLDHNCQKCCHKLVNHETTDIQMIKECMDYDELQIQSINQIKCSHFQCFT